MSIIGIKPKTLARGLRTGTYRETDLGIEKQCTRCGEFWPVDDEFFFRQRETEYWRYSSMCKACYLERYDRISGAGGRPTRAAKGAT